jgi:hypothetical protein
MSRITVYLHRAGCTYVWLRRASAPRATIACYNCEAAKRKRAIQRRRS